MLVLPDRIVVGIIFAPYRRTLLRCHSLCLHSLDALHKGRLSIRLKIGGKHAALINA